MANFGIIVISGPLIIIQIAIQRLIAARYLDTLHYDLHQ
jgi:hypothetical protein